MIAKFIASLGESPLFVAFNAHCWFAFSVVYVLAIHGVPEVPLMVVVILMAAMKEFWFDATYETSPPQTFWDNLEDFGGYCSGVFLAAMALAL